MKLKNSRFARHFSKMVHFPECFWEVCNAQRHDAFYLNQEVTNTEQLTYNLLSSSFYENWSLQMNMRYSTKVK